MGTIPKQEKATFGKSLNELKKLAQQTFDQAKEAQISIEAVSVSAERYKLDAHPITRWICASINQDFARDEKKYLLQAWV